MIFKNEKHSAAFRDAVRKLDQKNNALMSAVYFRFIRLLVSGRAFQICTHPYTFWRF